MTAKDPHTVEVTFVGHATVALEMGGQTVITDPVLTSRLKHLRRMAPASNFDPATVDLVLISHQHHDHLHVQSLKRIPRTAHVVVPLGLGTKVRKLGFDRVTEVVVGESATEGDVTATAVPAFHDDRRHPGAPRIHPIGYRIEAFGWSAYFPGDTEVFAGMADIDVDLTLIPVWGWGPTLGGGHLDPTEAARALELLGSPLAIPIHWGTLWPYHVKPTDRLVMPPRELVDAVNELSLDVEIIEIEPGGTRELSV